VTHRPEEEPKDGEFTFVSGVEAAVERALRSAGDKDVHVMGGAEIIRQALEAGIVDELSIIVAPVVLGGGNRLFEGFSPVAGPGAPRGAAVTVRDVHRLPGRLARPVFVHRCQRGVGRERRREGSVGTMPVGLVA
jgi:riboflavin biosynthesis pyrimidine reductase